jgi:hypothetical protein
MTVPSHNLYDFVHQVTEKRYWILRTYPWGSKELADLRDYQLDIHEADGFVDLDVPNGIPEQFRTVHQVFPTALPHMPYYVQVRNYQPVLVCCDQEPLNFEFYQDHSEFMQRFRQSTANESSYPHENFNLRNIIPSSWQKKWTLLHSELDSAELVKYENTGKYVGAYWWSHAVIALDWYRYARHDLSLQHVVPEKLFLVYARDLTGSRQYRKDFLNLICDLTQHCQIGSVDAQQVTSNHSAIYSAQDLNHTAFSVVLETVFDDRIHLTEKILRPIACGHPFILAAGSGSLALLRRYGFETFSPWINEDYDDIKDSRDRVIAITTEMRRISQLPKSQQNLMIDECRAIAKRNQERFFNPDFLKTIVDELKENVAQAWNQHQGQLSPDYHWDRLKWLRKNSPEWFTPEKQEILKMTVPLIRRLRGST